MSFSSFFRRDIHNQQHWLDMNKKSQNCYKAKKLWAPKHYKHVTPCKNTFRLFPRRITMRFAVSLRKSVGVLC